MKKLQFLKPLLNFVFIALLITTVSRFILFLIYKDRVDGVDNYWQLFPIGLRIDLILISYLSFIPATLLFLLPDKLAKYTSRFLTVYFVLFLFLIFFMEIVSPDFIDQYDTRPNKLFLEYLIYPKEVANMLLKGRIWTVIVVLVLSGAALYFGFKKGAGLFKVRPSQYKYRLLLFPLAVFFLFWGARGSLTSKRPINPSNAMFSNDQLTNCLALNSMYTLFYAAYGLKNEVDAGKMYGKMDTEEAIARVKKYMNVADSDFTDANLPLMHIQMPDSL